MAGEPEVLRFRGDPRDPLNVAAVKQWIRDHRMDLAYGIEVLFRSEDEKSRATQALLLIGFEAGRVFQRDHPDVPMDTPAAYLAQAFPQTFSDHIDLCRRCHDNPFDLCETGQRLLVAAVDAGDRP